MREKLNLGCGDKIFPEYINVDICPLDGVDVVCDLSQKFPFRDDVFSHIEMINVLEHLPDTIKAMEELHRISKHNCTIYIRVPYWNGFHNHFCSTILFMDLHLRTIKNT